RPGARADQGGARHGREEGEEGRAQGAEAREQGHAHGAQAREPEGKRAADATEVAERCRGLRSPPPSCSSPWGPPARAGTTRCSPPSRSSRSRGTTCRRQTPPTRGHRHAAIEHIDRALREIREAIQVARGRVPELGQERKATKKKPEPSEADGD